MSIFFSYSREDRSTVDKLFEMLTAKGYEIFIDRDIERGSDFRSRITTELKKAKCVVVFWSETAVTSNWVIEEANFGLQQGILVPVLLDNTLPPIGFGETNAVNLQTWSEDPSDPEFVKFCLAIDWVLEGGNHTEQNLRDGLSKILSPLPGKDYRQFKTGQVDLNQSVADMLSKFSDLQTEVSTQEKMRSQRMQATTRRLELMLYPFIFALYVSLVYGAYLIYVTTKDFHTIASSIDPDMGKHFNDITQSVVYSAENMRTMTRDINSMAQDINSVAMECIPRR